MKVTVYSTPTCPWCKKIKSLLEKNSIEFIDIDVSVDTKMAQKMVHKTGQMGVPVTEIDGEVVIGYDEKKLTDLLKI